MKKMRWFKEQEERKKKKILRFFLGAIFVTFLSASGFLVLFFGREIGRNRFDGAENINLIFVHNPPIILSLSPSKKTINAIIIPSETYIETAMGYGFYRADNIFDLDKMEKKQGELFLLSFEKFLAVPISAWIDDEKFPQQNILDYHFWWKVRNLSYLISSYKKRWRTNLSPFEIVRFWWSARGVKTDRITTLDLRRTAVFTPLALSDQSIVLKTDYDKLDSYSQKIFEESLAKKENLKVEIFNATNFPGLASFAARLLKNIGMDIVSVRNFDGEKQPLSQMKTLSDLEKSHSRRLMEKIFLSARKTSGFGENLQADITLILGEDYGEKIYGERKNFP